MKEKEKKAEEAEEKKENPCENCNLANWNDFEKCLCPEKLGLKDNFSRGMDCYD